MNESVYLIFILSIIFGAIHGLYGSDYLVEPSKNLISFIFGDE